MRKMMVLVLLLICFGGNALAGMELNRVEEVSPSYLTEMNGVLYFIGYDPLYGYTLAKTDGSREGTEVVKVFDTGGAYEQPRGLINAGGTLYFCAYEAVSGWELWKSDGTAGGTGMVTEINPGAADGVSGVYCHLAYLDNKIFFGGIDPVSGETLWKTDGTAANTVMVHDLQPATGNGIPQYLFAMGTTLYFVGNNGSNGYEMWKCEGPSYDSATMIKDIWPGIFGGVSVDDTRRPVVLNGYFYFQGADGLNNYELWRSDGTAANTTMVKDINGSGSGYPINFTLVGNTLYFAADDGTNGRELWKSNGTAGDTVMVKDINGSGSSNPGDLTAVGTTLYFSATDGSNGNEPWKSDGSGSGTVLVKDINPTSDSYPSYYTEFAGEVYFMATDGSNGYELWKSNGTAGGTTMAEDIVPGSGSSWPQNFLVMNNALYFRATYNTSVPEGDGDGLYRYGRMSSDFYWPTFLSIIIHNAIGRK